MYSIVNKGDVQMRLSFKKWNELQGSIEKWLEVGNYELIDKLVDSLVEEGYDALHIEKLIKTIEKKIILKSA
jgi:hypothetical protein